MVGVPAKQIGWTSEYGEKLDPPLTGEALTVCPHTGTRYIFSGGQLSATEPQLNDRINSWNNAMKILFCG